MQRNGEVARTLEPPHVRPARRTLMNRSEALATLLALLVVAVWLLASWTATAAEIVLSASAGGLANGRATVLPATPQTTSQVVCCASTSMVSVGQQRDREQRVAGARSRGWHAQVLNPR